MELSQDSIKIKRSTRVILAFEPTVTMGEQPDTEPFEGYAAERRQSSATAIKLPDQKRTIQLDLKWVRWEAYKRYHAVYVSALGVHWTYCGRSIRPGAVLDEREQPPAQCRHCRLRLRSSYLVPDQLKALRVGQGLPVRE
jgi:hypothetical protein